MQYCVVVFCFWFDAYRPGKHFFCHVGTEPTLPGYYQYFFFFLGGGGVVICLAQGHKMANRVRLEPPTSGSGVRGVIHQATAPQMHYLGSGKIRKQIFDFWRTGEQAILFLGNKRTGTPIHWDGLNIVAVISKNMSCIVS